MTTCNSYEYLLSNWIIKTFDARILERATRKKKREKKTKPNNKATKPIHMNHDETFYEIYHNSNDDARYFFSM